LPAAVSAWTRDQLHGRSIESQIEAIDADDAVAVSPLGADGKEPPLPTGVNRAGPLISSRTPGVTLFANADAAGGVIGSGSIRDQMSPTGAPGSAHKKFRCYRKGTVRRRLKPAGVQLGGRRSIRDTRGCAGRLRPDRIRRGCDLLPGVSILRLPPPDRADSDLQPPWWTGENVRAEVNPAVNRPLTTSTGLTGNGAPTTVTPSSES
jgi:hypothetical protein